MAHTNKIICPNCGAEMNHHAFKIDYGVNDTVLVDQTFGGELKEVHTCPQCATTELRVAT